MVANLSNDFNKKFILEFFSMEFLQNEENNIILFIC